jgi:hypothetical protein
LLRQFWQADPLFLPFLTAKWCSEIVNRRQIVARLSPTAHGFSRQPLLDQCPGSSAGPAARWNEIRNQRLLRERNDFSGGAAADAWL